MVYTKAVSLSQRTRGGTRSNRAREPGTWPTTGLEASGSLPAGVKTVAAAAVDAESKGYDPDRPRNLSRSVIPSF
ncbi:hypothetical protein ACFYY1_20130 [Streptomyces sp. NPDC001890]|uniref:hypothetical protein n=1 Tax=Streptomyces sp. NPDC001890 TaxID=3364620 RepID=UPI0036C4CC7B